MICECLRAGSGNSSFSMSTHGVHHHEQALWTIDFLVERIFRRTTFPVPRDLVML